MSASMSEAPGSAAGTSKDQLRELVESMNQRRATFAGHDPRLSNQIEALAQKLREPGQIENAEFRTRVAYAFQDFTRLAGPVVGISDTLRAELERLATTAPGLQNARLHDLLREVPNLTDRKLAGDVRKAAMAIGREEGDQNRPDVLAQVEALERRFAAMEAGRRANRSASADPAPRPGADSPSSGTVTPVPPPEKPRFEERVVASASPGEGTRTQRHAEPVAQPSPTSPAGVSRPPEPAAPLQAGGHQEAVVGRGSGILVRMMSSMAEPRPAMSPPWEQPATPLGDRIGAFLSQHGDRRALETAEASGQKAMEALRSLNQGPGAGIMARISDAARSDPRGIEGVVSEMREGGRHAELRTQFNNALVQQKGLAVAFDAAVGAVRQYGTDRQAAEAVILKRSDPAVLAGRFERLDAQIGEAASQVPSRQEGKSVMEELGQRVAELVRRATEAVRAAFRSEPRATASSGPSPGP